MRKLILITVFISNVFAFAQTNQFYITDDSPLRLEKPNPFSTEQIEAAKHAKDSRPANDDPEGNWGAVSEGFQMSARLAKGSFTNGEPVQLCIILRNVSDKTLPFEYFNAGDPLITTTLTKGQDILQRLDEGPGTNFIDSIRKLKVGSSYLYTSSPGTQRKFYVDLNTVYNLSTNGSYEILANKLVGKTKQHTRIDVVSGKATFQITAQP